MKRLSGILFASGLVSALLGFAASAQDNNTQDNNAPPAIPSPAQEELVKQSSSQNWQMMTPEERTAAKERMRDSVQQHVMENYGGNAGGDGGAYAPQGAGQ